MLMNQPSPITAEYYYDINSNQPYLFVAYNKECLNSGNGLLIDNYDQAVMFIKALTKMNEAQKDYHEAMKMAGHW